MTPGSKERVCRPENFSFPEALNLFIDQAIKSGRYKSASEVVRAALRLLEQQEKENPEKLIRLKAAIAEALASAVASEGAFARVRELAGLPLRIHEDA